MNESSDPAYALIGAIVKTMTELMPGDIIGVDPADMVAVLEVWENNQGQKSN